MYSCHGLVLDSELPLPELTPAPAGVPDVVVRVGPVTTPGATAVLLPHGMWVDGETAGVDVPQVGRFLAEGGTRITVQPYDDAAPATVRLFLLGTALGFLLVQRGLLVLHGNAFRVGASCAVVLGHSGAGKSTLAAEMHRRGLDVLSDDVVPVDATGHALPGFARIKLWQDALDRLGVPSDGLARVRAEHAKFHLPIERAAVDPLPVRWLYLLDRHDGPLRLVPVRGAEVFNALHEHAYRHEILVGAHRRTHLVRSAALAASARLTRVDRPRGVDSVAASAAAILADIDATPAREEHHVRTA